MAGRPKKSGAAESGRSGQVFLPARLLDRTASGTHMIDGLLLAAAMTVILVLYHKVKAWDDRHETAPVRSTRLR